MKIEIWKNVREFSGLYQVSNLGRVRSLNRLVYHSGNGSYHIITGKIISSRINNCGYLSVRLSRNGKNHTRFIHRLMALAFIENLENKKYINHKDGVKTNNLLDNLEWATHRENMLHAYALGLIRKKINQPTSSPTAMQKLKTKCLKKDGIRIGQEGVLK